jgi:putative SOS response-associated peptidase YedK
MCYSTALRKQREDIEHQLRKEINSNIVLTESYQPYFHLNGFTHGNLYILTMEDQTKIQPAAWGLVPDWGTHDAKHFWKTANTLNARSESIFEKASFKASALNKRCLILADGFFEPHHTKGQIIPYFCYQPNVNHPEGALFLFAGLYNEMDSGSYSATILTTAADDFFAKIHNKKKRMPLVLDAHYYEDWLDDGLNPQSVNELMAEGFSSIPFKAHPVSRDLYKRNADTNSAYIVEPVQPNTLF